MKFLLAIDLETTGLDSSYNEIMQIGAILLNKELKQLGEFKTLVSVNYPKRGIRNIDGERFNVYEYTNIDPNKLRLAPSLEQSLVKLIRFIKHNSGLKEREFGQITIFGQNPKFDYNFLRNAFKKCNMNSEMFDYHVVGLDSIFAFCHLWEYGTLPKKLSQHHMCETFGIMNPHEHDALYDIRTSVAILKILQQRIANV